MSNNDQPKLIKAPYSKTVFNNQTELEEFVKCCDPENGYQYFMDNFFMIQHPTRGCVNYQPYEYQRKMARVYNSYNRSIINIFRQAGKTTTAAGYLLWYAMFNSDATVLIAAHKFSGAQEIMVRVRHAFEACPNHIKAGAVSYNKGSIEFDNGSRIVATTTTENTGRGMSISLLYCLDGETTVKIRHKETKIEEDITLAQLYARLSPNTIVISDGEADNV